jgi:hypothetical protein
MRDKGGRRRRDIREGRETREGMREGVNRHSLQAASPLRGYVAEGKKKYLEHLVRIADSR